MADNSVFITGATEGAFTDALKDLPPWATEKTAYKIQGILKKSLDAQTKTLAQLVRSATSATGSSGTNNNTTQTNTELAKLVKLLAAQNAEEDKGKKRRKAKEDEDDKSLYNLKAYNTSQKRTTLLLNGLQSASENIVGAAQDYIKTYDGLYKSGINVMSGNDTVASGMLALNQVVTLTGLRLQTLQKVAEKYSTSINAIGFLKFAKATANAKDAMVGLGYSSEETANLVGAYTDMQMYSTDMRRKSDQEITADVKVFAKRVTEASLAMGVSREQILANSAALAESTDMSVIEAQSGAEAAKNVSAALMGIKPELAAKFLSLVADTGTGFGMLNPTVQALMLSTSKFSGEIQQMGRDMKTMSPKEMRGKWGELVDSPLWKADLAQMHTLSVAGIDSAKTTEQLMVMMQNQAHRFNEATDGQVKTATKTEASIAGLQTEQEKFAASMQSLFVPLEGQIDAVTSGFKLLNAGVSALTDNISATTRSNIGVGTVLATFVAGVLIPKLFSIASFFNLAGAASGTASAAATAAASGAASAATAATATTGFLVTALTALKVGGVGLSAALHSGDLNSNEDDELARRRNLGPEITKKNAEVSGPKNTAPEITKKNTEISVPKNPAPSVINSPSAIPTNPAPSGLNVAEQAAADPATPIIPGIEKHTNNNKINSTMALQIDIMQQLLDKTATLVSVQQDMLQVARNR
jgi:hypothetical protein